MQHSLTTATPFKSQKILFKARALGSNLIHRRLSTSQLPSQFIPLMGSFPRASRGSAIHVFVVIIYRWKNPSSWINPVALSSMAIGCLENHNALWRHYSGWREELLHFLSYIFTENVPRKTQEMPLEPPSLGRLWLSNFCSWAYIFKSYAMRAPVSLVLNEVVQAHH